MPLLTVTVRAQALWVAQTHVASVSVDVTTADPNSWDVTLRPLPGAAGVRDWVTIEPTWSTAGPGSRATFALAVAVPAEAPTGPAAFVLAAAARPAGSANSPVTAGHSLPVTVFVQPLWTLAPDLSELDLTVGVPVEFGYTVRGLPGSRARLSVEVQQSGQIRAWSAPVAFVARGPGGRYGQELPSAV